ncbi:restriction endonuclease subunit S [Flavivirga rizhaonensis]|uniref:Restriction endonuclease subunit S n=1 Tax=Flavivirga rizhaonensis TaxID=2559571 RepID=A0A4V6R482_9FLAO|nr:restriction endonuclease subunit S [Flavivirga rizhaonensis]TGV03394.1 restriction endonuclease subunit S [Flavivirga rizhaonensis]
MGSKQIYKPIKDCCLLVTDGAHKSPKTLDEGFPYVTVRDIGDDGSIDTANCKKISLKDFNLLANGNCQPLYGDILFSKDGTVGKVALVKNEKEFVVLSSLTILRPDRKLIDSTFFKYIMLSPNIQDEAIGLKTGAAIKRVVLRTIKEIKIPLPALPEQQRIVAKLDGLFAKIDKAIGLLEENIAHTQALMGSVLDEEFNKRKKIEYVKASEIGKVIRGSSPRPKGDPRYYGGKVPRLMVADVTRDGMYVTPRIDFLTEEGKLKSRPCPKGTLTIQVSGNPGTPSILNVDACIHDGFAAIINIDENVWSKRFLYHYLILKKIEYSQLAKGATFQNIKTDIIRDFDIPLIDKNDQEKISDNIENKNRTIKLLVETQTQKLNHLKALKSSLLDQAFKGEL